MSEPSYDNHLDQLLHDHLNAKSNLDRDFDDGTLTQWAIDTFGPQVDQIHQAWKEISDAWMERYDEHIRETWGMYDVIELFPDPETTPKTKEN